MVLGGDHGCCGHGSCETATAIAGLAMAPFVQPERGIARFLVLPLWHLAVAA